METLGDPRRIILGALIYLWRSEESGGGGILPTVKYLGILLALPNHFGLLLFSFTVKSLSPLSLGTYGVSHTLR